MLNDKLFSHLRRIYKNITDSVKQKGPAFQKVFEFCYKYKLKCCQEGKGTPVMDKLVFNKVKSNFNDTPLYQLN